MKQLTTYTFFFVLLAAVSIFATCNNSGGQMPRMVPPYMFRDKEPMGTNIAYRLLPTQFSAPVTLASKKMRGLVNEYAYAKATSYISVGKNIVLGDEELEQLLSYVHRGNEFFISADNVDYRLLDTLGVQRDIDPAPEDTLDEIQRSKQNTFLTMADTAAFGGGHYGFFYYPFRRSK